MSHTVFEKTILKENQLTMLLTSAYWLLGDKARSSSSERSYIKNFANTAAVHIVSIGVLILLAVFFMVFPHHQLPHAFSMAALALVAVVIVFFALRHRPARFPQLQLSSRKRPFLFLCWPDDDLPERAHKCIHGMRIFNADMFEVITITATNLGDFVGSDALAEWRSSPVTMPEKRLYDMQRRLLRCCGGVALPACCIAFAPLREVLLMLTDQTIFGYDQEGGHFSAIAALPIPADADYLKSKTLSTDLVDIASRRHLLRSGQQPPSALILDVEGMDDMFFSISNNMAQEFSASRIACNVEACYVLNLDVDTQRWKDLMEDFSLHFPGATWPRRQSAPSTPCNGALGCLQGHLAMVKRASHEAIRRNVLILEDDAQALRDVHSALDDFFSEPERAMAWDVILLAANVLEEEVIAGSVVNRARDVQVAAAYIVRAGYVATLAETFSRALQENEVEGKWRGEFCADQCWKTLQRQDRWFVFKDCVIQQRPTFSNIEQKRVFYGWTCGRTA